ncbi:MAG: diguanylate cyclase [Ilumatobacteraceae bacterium]
MSTDRDEFAVLAAEILDALPERVVRFRLSDLTIVYCNHSWASGHGLTPSEVVGRELHEFLSADGRAGLTRQLGRLGPESPMLPDKVAREHLTTPGRWIEWVDRWLPTGEVIAIGRDVTERRSFEQALMESEARFRELAENSSDMVFRFLVAPTPHFDYLSPSVETITGYPVTMFLEDFGRFADMLDEDGRALIERAISGAPMPERSDIRGKRADGSDIVTEIHLSPIPGGLQGVGSDVTENRRLQAEIASLAYHDALTGLANRHLLEELMTVAMARTERHSVPLAAAFVDLDGFKQVNDVHGHECGDVVLREVARRMVEVARSADIVARVGGDEFVIIYEPNEAGADSLVDRLDEALAEPFTIGTSLVIPSRASIGYADTRAVGRNPSALIAAADAAMYEVKRAHHAAQPQPPAASA